MMAFLFIVIILSVILATGNAQAPFYYLPNQYSFNGAANTWVPLTDLVCVKGNNARSIKFQMRTSTIPTSGLGWGTLIGMYILMMLHVDVYITNNLCDWK